MNLGGGMVYDAMGRGNGPVEWPHRDIRHLITCLLLTQLGLASLEIMTTKWTS